MKLKQRLWVCLGCISVVFLCLVTIDLGSAPSRTLDPLSPWPEEASLRSLGRLNKLSLGRNLNMVSGEKTIPVLLSRILSSLGRDGALDTEDSQQVLEAVLADRNLSEAVIDMAHLLEEHRHKQRSLTKEELPGDGMDPPEAGPDPASDEDTRVLDGNLHTGLDDNMILELQHALHKIGFHRKHRRVKAKNLPRYKNMYIMDDSPSFERFHSEINDFELYSSNGTTVDKLLSEMTSLPFTSMDQKSGGTQLKLTFYMEDQSQTMFKPMRFPREQETLPNHFYFSDYERHNAEIAAFHLDRILEFRRVPPTTGRMVNVTQDIWRYADRKLEKTFFISPAGNVCFHGQCEYYCDTGHAICGHPELLEGSFSAYLPDQDLAPRTRWRHPWRRSYHKRKKAQWETDYEYCDSVRDMEPYDSGRRLLDLMDMAVFDFLTGNMDRHHYETFTDFDNETFPILFDNGRSFGKASHDELTILAPVYQCCLLRASTLSRLLALRTGPQNLSRLLRASLARDSLVPILTDGHLLALDRRLATVLVIVHECLGEHRRPHRVVVDDGY